MIRRVVVDADLPPLDPGPQVEVVVLDPAAPVDIDARTLVVSADEAVLATAGAAGGHRMVRGDDDATTLTAVAELIRELGRDRP